MAVAIIITTQSSRNTPVNNQAQQPADNVSGHSIAEPTQTPSAPTADSVPAPIPTLNTTHEPIDGYITIRGERYSVELTELDILDNDLNNEDIVPLRYMTKLRKLRISGEIRQDGNSTVYHSNQVNDLSALSGLTSLTELDIRGRQISDLSPLSGLTNLTGLFLAVCQISDLRPLSSLINLETLSLADNQISDIRPLENLMNLETLHLDDNPIADWSPVSHVYYVGGRPHIPVPVHPDRNSGNDTDNVPEVSRQESGGMGVGIMGVR